MDPREAVVELKERYVRLVDGQEWPSLAACFAVDFEFEGQFAVRGAEAFVDRVRADLADAVTVHTLGSPQISLETEHRARAVWPFSDAIDQRRDGSGLFRRGSGHYHEHYARSGDHWLIRGMRITRERVECEVYAGGALIRAHTCLSQAELVEWLRKERTT